eukprot:TRINITY_DN12276_c0_g2_i2.p1 TRINITY_DN12276_c0_g2~~TRINITY_DN12276_c0_g2_i2.p1  ORF type:complete len:484 (+),score=102.14 TRINITY_DN12276_c0_g2_i2:130-1452(+)
MAPNTAKLVTWMTDNQEEGVRSRGAVIKMHPNGFEGKPIRTYPWNLIPDNLMIAISSVYLLFVGPVMTAIIGSAMAAWALTCGLHMLIPGVFTAVRKAIMGAAKWAGDRILVDPRNHNYLPWQFFMMVWAPALLYIAYQRHMTYGFEPVFFLLYHVCRIGPRFRLFAHAHVLVHKEGHDHKGLHKGPFRAINYINQWWIGMFYGQTPMSYETGHNKIHHRYDNGLDDMHTNLDLDRSKTISLLIYFPRFWLYWSGISNTIFFLSRGMWSLGFRSGLGCLVHHAVMIAACQHNFTFGMAYVVYPYFEATLFLCLISYLWHAWMDPKDPSNAYVNSVTILDGHDNIWNEDYHVVHHVSKCHWTEYPAHYERNIPNYIKAKATIFRDCEEGLLLGWLLTKDWDKLAEHFVDLEDKMSHEEKKALLLERLKATISKVQPTKKSN